MNAKTFKLKRSYDNYNKLLLRMWIKMVQRNGDKNLLENFIFKSMENITLVKQS